MTKCNKKGRWGFLVALLAGLLYLGAYANNGQAQNRTLQGDHSKSGAFLNQTNQYLNKKISLDIKNQTRLEAVRQIAQKAGMKLTYNTELQALNQTIQLIYKEIMVEEALWKALEGAHIRFAVSKSGQLALFPHTGALKQAAATGTITGTVTDARTGEPLPGANIRIEETNRGTAANSDGQYILENIEAGDYMLTASFVGYEPKFRPIVVYANDTLTVNFELGLAGGQLDEVTVVSTGYQEIPKERATGSFVQLDNEVLNQSVSTDIISRVEGRVSGLQFDRRSTGSGSGIANDENYRELRIRGASNLDRDTEPLIVVDNFPFEGDVSNINPNDVKSVTVLKDAAAASIWGARAGNGVIVITTKKGRYNQPAKVSFSSSVLVREAPDLFYNPEFMSSSDFIEVEQMLFDEGLYTSDENSFREPLLSPAVEIMIQERDGMISSAEAASQLEQLRSQDVRKEAEKYLFRNAVQQQYAINVEGGSDKVQYYLSGGYDKNISSTVGDNYERISLTSNNDFQPLAWLKVHAGVSFVQNNSENNGMGWSDDISRFPYNKLADENGNALPIGNEYRLAYVDQAESNGLLDWHYRPLDEMEMKDVTIKSTHTRMNTAAKIIMSDALDLDIRYQYVKTSGTERRYDSPSSYDVRNQVNRFTQPDGTRVFPLGGTLWTANEEETAYSARAQINYRDVFAKDHEVYALAGFEVGQNVHKTNYNELIGYDDELLTYKNSFDYTTRYPIRPGGSSYMPTPFNDLEELLDRFISYYGNASYTYQKTYTATGSVRWDGSNLFGVKTNQKGVPLWSLGASWNISNESFYNISWLEYLKIRATYGYNGNVNKSVTAYPTATYSTHWLTDLTYGEVRSPGNPELRWEKIQTLNVGVDFSALGKRISGAIELYSKKGTDLLGETPVDPTTGFLDNIQTNYGSTLTRGMDIELQTANVTGEVSWNTSILFSYINNEVTENKETYSYTDLRTATYLNYSLLPREGKPVDGLYSLPWVGLDPATGDPQVMLDGEISKNYSQYFSQLTVDQLVYHGSSVPTMFGSVINSVMWKNFSLSFNIRWKANYYFRRSSIDYDGLFDDWEMHRDYTKRWQSPGDENKTQVPSMPLTGDSNRDGVYTGSEILVERGDHIRLQDVNLSYTLPHTILQRLPFRNLRVFAYARNLGILWRANKHGLDPDYPSSNFPPARIISFGINAAL